MGCANRKKRKGTKNGKLSESFKNTLFFLRQNLCAFISNSLYQIQHCRKANKELMEMTDLLINCGETG